MPISRRELMGAALGAGLAPWLGSCAGGEPAPPPPPSESLEILVLGGTGFLGPHTVRAALARGHGITLFNRGRTNPGLFPALETVIGDRNTDLERLAGRRWDAVIDTSGYLPRQVRAAAAQLAGQSSHYLFVSSVSVYRDFSTPGMDETAPLAPLADESVEQVTGETYGPLKAACERALVDVMPARHTIVRPGLIAGPGDPTDRFTYWPVRIARAGEVLAPGDGSTPVQFIDARDLGAWMVSCLETRRRGAYNAISPPGWCDMRGLLEDCIAVTGTATSLVWVDADFLAAHEVAPWTDMPVWVPAAGETAGFALISTDRAQAAGLTVRERSGTIGDTLAWFATLPAERRASLRAGLSREREQAVLTAWRNR